MVDGCVGLCVPSRVLGLFFYIPDKESGKREEKPFFENMQGQAFSERVIAAFNTTAEFWLHAQENYDLAKARKRVDVKQVKVFWQPQVA